MCIRDRLYSGQEYAPRHRVDLFNADDAYCDMRLDLQPYLKQLRQMKRTLPMSACFCLLYTAPQHVKGNVLIITPGDENDLLREGAQPGNGAGGAGGDGVVIVPHPVIGTYQLDAMLRCV